MRACVHTRWHAPIRMCVHTHSVACTRMPMGAGVLSFAVLIFLCEKYYHLCFKVVIVVLDVLFYQFVFLQDFFV